VRDASDATYLMLLIGNRPRYKIKKISTIWRLTPCRMMPVLP
jgi:hypothetical protein